VHDVIARIIIIKYCYYGFSRRTIINDHHNILLYNIPRRLSSICDYYCFLMVMVVVDDVRQRRHHHHHDHCRLGRIIITNIMYGHNYIIIIVRPPLISFYLLYIIMSQATHTGLTRAITRV